MRKHLLCKSSSVLFACAIVVVTSGLLAVTLSVVASTSCPFGAEVVFRYFMNAFIKAHVVIELVFVSTGSRGLIASASLSKRCSLEVLTSVNERGDFVSTDHSGDGCKNEFEH